MAKFTLTCEFDSAEDLNEFIGKGAAAVVLTDVHAPEAEKAAVESAEQSRRRRRTKAEIQAEAEAEQVVKVVQVIEVLPPEAIIGAPGTVEIIQPQQTLSPMAMPTFNFSAADVPPVQHMPANIITMSPTQPVEITKPNMGLPSDLLSALGGTAS